ncbi:cupin-like domain-containing protein [Novosphingobium huizhouense]|uniref:cupin-like domain-containing protein n=1 Tax=Novosphingobium huizhouense TaxID=2866625 RepID=UPI001CD8C386|nr:cupin-like domain-containing protein [Novosphingobium huizhouense]
MAALPEAGGRAAEAAGLVELAADDPALRDPAAFRGTVVAAGRPAVIRGLCADLPATGAARRSPRAALDYLLGFDVGRRPQVFTAAPEIGGRYYYSDDLAGFNFTRSERSLAEAFALIERHIDDPAQPTSYIGSLVAPAYLPGFAEANTLPAVPAGTEPRLWIGNGSTAACHYDAYENLACVLAGERRFTLYPPDAIGDLYVGPIDRTMAGQPVSLAAAAADPSAYPRFAAARARAITVELAAGDALFLPKLWWHEVAARAPFNLMLNYWWDATATGPDAPLLALLLAMITIAERPEAERAAFRAFFDHYVFRPDGHPLAHLPEDRRGVLGDLSGAGYGQIRAMVLRALRGG